MEKDALKVAHEMKAEYWAVSSLTGESQTSGLPSALASLPTLPLTPPPPAVPIDPRPGTAPEHPSAPCVR